MAGLPIHLHAKIRTAVRRPKTRSTTVMSDLAGATSFAARCAATSEFMAYSMGCRCTRRRRPAVVERGDVALIRASSTPRRRESHHLDPPSAMPRQVSRGAGSDFVPAARKVRRLDVHKQQQPAACCTHLLPICPLRRPARESGMKTAQEQRGSGRPLYSIQQHVAALKTAHTWRKHAYTPTFVRSNIF